MSTHSTIAVQLKDGSIKQVYCHWDGYIEHNGKLLVNHYNTQELAEELVSFGDISSLDERIVPVSSLHSVSNPERGVTAFYGRDRSEDDTAPSIHKDYLSYVRGRREEYNYLFRDGRWECTFDDGNRSVIVSEYLNRVL